MTPTQETIHANLDQLATVGRMALGLFLACGPDDVADALAVQIARAAAGDHAGQQAGDWLDAAATMEMLAAGLKRNARNAIGCALSCGATYDQVGTALGISRQAAWERFNRA